MKMIPNSLLPNNYMQACPDTIFTVLVRNTMSANYEKFAKLKNCVFVHGLLKYPEWSPTSDIFQFIDSDSLQLIQSKKSFFIFDASTEGFSPIHDFPFFSMLYFNCEKYNIDPKMIIYVSANLRDEENIKNYSKENNVEPIRVFSFLSFEQVLAVDDRKRNIETQKQFQSAKSNCEEKFVDKFFSSLSRVNRKHRTLGTFMLCQSEIESRGLISHDRVRVRKESIPQWIAHQGITDYSEKQVMRWFKSLPRIIDQTNFNINWAINTQYNHIHDSTLFQIVNETLVIDHQRTSLFYSEKTFRPIAVFQPFVIYGQQGCNYALKDLGYQIYEEWFDLSFDLEPDPIIRYKKMLAMLVDQCKMLESLSREDQINWRFKNQEILLHNFNTMIQSQYSKDKLVNFLEKLSNEIN